MELIEFLVVGLPFEEDLSEPVLDLLLPLHQLIQTLKINKMTAGDHQGVMLSNRCVSCAMSSELVLLQQKKWPFWINSRNSPPPLPSSSPELSFISSSHTPDPGTTIIGISFYTHILTSSTMSKRASATRMLTILQRETPSALFLPSAMRRQMSILNWTSPPHFKSLSGLSAKRCVWPLASSVPSTCEGFILGNFISPSGAIPTNFTPLLNVNFYRPEARPLSTITASVLKAALATPAQNLPLPFSMAPMILMTGAISVYLNLSSISRMGRFFLQTLLTLMSLASLPPGKRKSQGFHRSSLARVLLTLTMEFLSLSSGFSSSFLAGLISCLDSTREADTSSLGFTGLFSSSLIY